MPDPSNVTDESPNHVSYFITSKFNDNKASGTCENIRSAIKHHYKRVIKVEDGWRKCDSSKKYVGNPCDALTVTELIKGIENVSRQRGDTTRRASPMTMDVLNKLWSFMSNCIIMNPGVAAEGMHLMAACPTCFCLWLRINELFKLKMKHTQLNVKVKPSVDSECHLVTLFFRKPDKDKEKEGRTHEVHKAHESEIGGCMKTFLDEWLLTYEGMLGRNLEPEDYSFPKLTEKGAFQLGE